MNPRKDTRLARRFLAELVLIGLVSGLFTNSISLSSNGHGSIEFFKSLDGKIFLGTCGLVIVSIMWNPFASMLELRMVCSGENRSTRLFRRIVRNLPRSVLLLFSGISSVIAINNPELDRGSHSVWIQHPLLNLVVSVFFLVYTFDKLWIFRDFENTFLDKLLGITFERS